MRRNFSSYNLSTNAVNYQASRYKVYCCTPACHQCISPIAFYSWTMHSDRWTPCNRNRGIPNHRYTLYAKAKDRYLNFTQLIMPDLWIFIADKFCSLSISFTDDTVFSSHRLNSLNQLRSLTLHENFSRVDQQILHTSVLSILSALQRYLGS